MDLPGVGGFADCQLSSELTFVCDGRDVLGDLHGALLQLANGVSEHLRHLVVWAELDQPGCFFDHNGVT